MLFEHLKKKTSHNSAEKLNVKEYEELIVGNDLTSLSFLKELIEQNKNANLCIQENLELKDLVPIGPSVIRGEENINIIKQYFSPVLSHDEPIHFDVKFYKDSSFFNFGGRKRPEKLMKNEEFFTHNRLNINEKDLILNSDLADFFAKNKDNFIKIKIQNIRRDFDHWELTFINGSKVKCKKLIWGQSPYLLLNSLSNKHEFSQSFIDFCQHTKQPLGVTITFKVHTNEPISNDNSTLFIPQSLTHEWGHFIGEFSEFNEKENFQEFTFFSFLDEENSDVEAVARKIHLLKRHLIKIYPELSKKEIDENIVVSDQKSPFFHESDHLFKKVKTEDLINLKFIGKDAPLSENFLHNHNIDFDSNKISFLSRAILSCQQLNESLEN